MIRGHTRHPGQVNQDTIVDNYGQVRIPEGAFTIDWTSIGSGGYIGPTGCYWSGEAPWLFIGDGKIIQVNNFDQVDFLTSDPKRVRMWKSDGWANFTGLWLNWASVSGTPPSTAGCPNLLEYVVDNCGWTGKPPNMKYNTLLQQLFIQNNNMVGPLPDPSSCPNLVYYHADNAGSGITGSIPAMASCTLLQELMLDNLGLSGTIPNLAPCSALTLLHICGMSGMTGYTAGGLVTQKNLSDAQFWGGSLTVTAVNQILRDCVLSLGGGRVGCNLELEGGSNAAPTGQGITDMATLNGTSGWLVRSN